MDGGWIGSIDISINKAFTARAFDILNLLLLTGFHLVGESSELNVFEPVGMERAIADRGLRSRVFIATKTGLE
jgi:hypothetical protein